jgi:hypothetical protein
MERYIRTIARAFAEFIISMSADGGEWSFNDVAAGRVTVTVTHTLPLRVEDRSWVVANERVMA